MSKKLLIIFGLCLVGIIILANTIHGVFGFVRYIPYGDKVLHFGLLGTLAFLVAQWVTLSRQSFSPSRLVMTGSLVAVLITLEEFSQIFIPSRTFDLTDMTLNILGIACGTLLFSILYTQSGLYKKMDRISL